MATTLSQMHTAMEVRDVTNVSRLLRLLSETFHQSLYYSKSVYSAFMQCSGMWYVRIWGPSAIIVALLRR